MTKEEMTAKVKELAQAVMKVELPSNMAFVVIVADTTGQHTVEMLSNVDNVGGVREVLQRTLEHTFDQNPGVIEEEGSGHDQ